MNVVDTSGWLEYFAGGKNADVFAEPIVKTEELIVPVICIYEISKVILRESDEDSLLQVLAAIQRAEVIALSSSISIAAAKVSLRHKLPMADSIIYATAAQYGAAVWTQDVDFEHLPNVNYIPKHRP